METSLRPIATGPRLGRPGPLTAQAVLAGLLLTAGMPPFLLTGLAAPLALALLLAALRQSAHPGRLAWQFGLAHQGSLLYWMFFLDPSKTIPSRALVPIQALATIFYVSLFYLLLGWVFGKLSRWRRVPGPLWLWPVLWTAMEALRARGEMGFPWCLSGAAFIRTPLLPLARTSGEIGLGAGAAVSAAAALGALDWWRQRRRPDRTAPGGGRTAVLLAAGALLWWGYLGAGAWIWESQAEPTGQMIPVAAIQPDVALADKWVAARLDSTRIPLTDLTERAGDLGARFIVWPETAVPAYLRYDAGLLNWTRTLVRRSGAYLFTGFPDAERTPAGVVRTFNSSGLFGPDGRLLAQYAKHHLLPIGESMPFTSWLPFLRRIDVGQAEWSAGEAAVPLALGPEAGGLRFSALICFESIFADLARRPVRLGSRCLVVITNDGWFGRTLGPRQHAWLAVMRAVENGVPVIRCANNGISFVCDARGRILDWLEIGRRGLVAAEIAPGPAGTLFVRLGAWPLAGFWALWLGLGLLAGRRGEATE